VEKILVGALGEEKLQKIQQGMPDYLKMQKETKTEIKSDIYEAIEVLSALGDFSNFKNCMIAKRK